MPRTPTIGERRETSLHRQLKSEYAGAGGATEVGFGAGFVADGVNARGEYFEVQIGSFGRLLKKAKMFAASGRLKIVHPIAVAKYIEVFDGSGERLYRRKSSRPGKIWDLFNALVYAAELPLFPGVEIELALIDVSETRLRDGKGSWRRGGVSIGDRSLLALRERITLQSPCDYLRFVPFARSEEFSAFDLAKKAGLRVPLSRKTLYVLSRIGVVERTGKSGNTYLYALRSSPRSKKWGKPL
ncbi:MAG: hypothetical protein FWE09_03055 [Treponema sp.]|nr:hypothetical protein [Treponema sp.]